MTNATTAAWRTVGGAAIVAALLLSASSAAAQTVAITGGTIVPVSGPRIPNGTVLIEGERISAVGADIPVPSGATIVDATGKFVYPGMIDSRTQLGLYEIGSVAGSRDENETGDFNPAMATYVALNAHSELIPVTRVSGVTSAIAAPRGGRIPGVAALIDLDGWTPDEISRIPLAALWVSYPAMEQGGGGGFFRRANVSPEEFRRRAEREVRELEEYFESAQSYASRHAQGTLPRVDRQLEAMVAAAQGEMLVVIDANSREQILGAIRFGERFELDIVIYGGDEAWQVADSLVAYDVPVILGSVLSNPGADDPFDAIYAQPGLLAEAGVRFAFSTADAANSRNLPFHAAMTVAHGLDPEIALRALTLAPAEIWGVADDLGSIEVGKVANLFVATGDPMDVRTVVEHVFIRGRAVEMSTRHSELYERFRGRP